MLLRDRLCHEPRRAVGAGATAAKVDVLLQNHMLMDPIQPKLDALARRRTGEANPFVAGRDGYQAFLGVMEGCTAVNLARRQDR